MTHESQNQPRLTSPDYRQERLDAIRRLYQDLFTDEGRLNPAELGALVTDEAVVLDRYEFRWPGKMHAKKQAFTPSKARLAPDMERSVDFDKTQNVIIEGENLEVLKLLSKAYYNKVKCIYIDPPYNTGHDFVYSDDYSEGKQAYWEKNGVFRDGVKMDTNTESAGRYHTNWLNMMMPRLLLAQMMLKDDGVIFLSIDDNEVHNLRKLMDEVFGEENVVSCFVWRRSGAGGLRGIFPVAIHEYIVCYVKNKEAQQKQWLAPYSEESFLMFDQEDQRGKYKTQALYLTSLKQVPNQFYFISLPDGTKARPKEGVGAWRFIQSTFNEELAKGNIVFKKTTTSPLVDENGNKAKFNIYTKQYLQKEGSNPSSCLPEDIVGQTRSAKAELGELLQADVFDYAKPTSLIKYVLGLIRSERDDIFLDFFAGSGTTAHAVMDLNKEDGGSRNFIMVQIPEATDEKSEAYKAGYKKISEITIERVKRAGERIHAEKPEVDTGFKVFNLMTSIFPENTYQPDPEKSEDENVKAFQEHLERAKQQLLFDPKNKETDLMYEILLKQGFTLTMSKEKLNTFTNNNIWKVTDSDPSTPLVAGRCALVCLDADLKASTIKALEGQKDIRFIGLHRAVDTTRKWELTQIFGEALVLY